MAHFAELDENNVVLQVIVVHNNERLKELTELSMKNKGVEFCETLIWSYANWVQTNFLHS